MHRILLTCVAVAISSCSSSSADEFPVYDVDKFCAQGVTEQIAADERPAAMAFCVSLMGMAKALSEAEWTKASAEDRTRCNGEATAMGEGNYARLQDCLATANQ